MNDDIKAGPRHPGKHLADILELVGMQRKELAIRTGVSEKYIEMLIHGAKDLSFAFARRLEYAVGLSMQQWMDMQAQYDEYRSDGNPPASGRCHAAPKKIQAAGRAEKRQRRNPVPS